VLLGVDGISDFDGMHSRQHDDEVQFCAFDLLVSEGDDLRKLPLSMRKTNLAYCLAAPTPSTPRPSSKARLVPICFITPA
jgi:ATP-dependent DNA ligase